MQFSLDQQLQSRHRSLLEQFSRDYLGSAFHIFEENQDRSFLGSKFPSRGKDKVTVLVESYRFYGIKLPFLFHKVTVFGPKLPFFVGPKLPFILGKSYRFWGKVTVYESYRCDIKLPFFW